MLRAPNDAALDEMFARLETHDDWLSGYFAAVAIGPDSIANDAWLDPILGRAQFSKEEMPGILALLLAMKDAITEAIREAPARVVPGATDADGAARFSAGFLAGTRLHPSWKRDEIGGARLIPFALLAGELPDEDLVDTDGAPIADKEAFLARHRGGLAAHLTDLRAHWMQRRVGAKVSRNDPCPCGSGKKYKKCCLT